MTRPNQPVGPKRAPGARPRGFSLIEALAALVVVSAGLLALAGMQAGLARNADLARQRSEAVRLAQEQLEKIRSFSQLAAVTTFSWDRFGWDNLDEDAVRAGSDTIDTSNATFTRNWNVRLVPPALRTAVVTVTWTDRTGTVQTVFLDSVVAENNPAFSGGLGVPPPTGKNLKQPKNRNLNIPMPAISLKGGQSAYQMADTPGDRYALIFNDASGFVVKHCFTTVSMDTDLDTCPAFDGYLLTGYIHRRPVKAKGKDVPPAWPGGIDLSDLSGKGVLTSASRCKLGQAIDPNTLADIADLYFYVCVLPVAKEGDTWDGRVRLSGVVEGAVVCRYQYASSRFLTPNERNVQDYQKVKQSLDNQNYLVSNETGDCPATTGSEGFEYILHQDCRASNTNRATDCPAVAFPAPS